MNQYRIAVIPGDNIGPEVTNEGLRVLRELENARVCTFSFETFPWGARHVLQTGRAAPENIVELLTPFDAIYIGAHGDPANVPDRFSSQQMMHPIRKGLDLYANVRPVKWWPGTQIPLKQTDPIDFVSMYVPPVLGIKLLPAIAEDLTVAAAALAGIADGDEESLKRLTDLLERGGAGVARIPGKQGGPPAAYAPSKIVKS